MSILTSEDLGLEPSVFKQAKFDNSPLSKVLTNNIKIILKTILNKNKFYTQNQIKRRFDLYFTA